MGLATMKMVNALRFISKFDPTPFFIVFIGVLLDIFTTRVALTLPGMYESRPFGNILFLELGGYFISIFVIQTISFLMFKYNYKTIYTGRLISYVLAFLPYIAVINNLEVLK